MIINSKSILCVAPHPDDETLGCGGILQLLKKRKKKIHWLICTTINGSKNFTHSKILERQKQINKVSKLFKFDSVFQSDFVTSTLDSIPLEKQVDFYSNIIDKTKADTILVPYKNDVHSDHRIVYDCIISASKSFRKNQVKTILSYETLSETNFILQKQESFNPNLFVDIDKFLNKKINIFKEYKSEIGELPFPRSEKAIQALAILRGTQANVKAAEAFMILKHIYD